ncbi:MAG: hypothetical protein H6Q68_815 [Firmicutes bacterium]|nr:hypothetical protein [Bacillota bacterium]
MSQLKSAVEYLQSLDIEAVALLPTVIGIVFAGELNSGEQETLGNFLIDIGDVLFTTSSLIEIKKAKDEEDAKSDQQTDASQSLKEEQEKMQRQIAELQRQNQEMQKAMQELQKMLKSILE